MGEIHIIIATQTTEIRHDTLTGLESVVMEGPTLPLGQREGNFQLDILKVTRSKRRGTLDAVQVVVESCRTKNGSLG